MKELLNPEDWDKIRVELKEYQNKLNMVVGIVGFMTALACLWTEHPSLYAFIGAIIFFILKSHVLSVFPKDVITLRKLAKEYPENEEIKSELKKLEKFLSVKSIMKNGKPAMIGYFFYWFVLVVEIPSVFLGVKWLELFYK